jgi:hypothetical protein
MNWTLFLCFIIALPVQSASDSEILALLALYESTGGLSWEWKHNEDLNGPRWTFSSFDQQDPCADDSLVVSGGEIMAWQGVTCDDVPIRCYALSSNCSIHELRLGAYGVSDNKLSAYYD